jgi:hypothetical protein
MILYLNQGCYTLSLGHELARIIFNDKYKYYIQMILWCSKGNLISNKGTNSRRAFDWDGWKLYRIDMSCDLILTSVF